MENITVKQLKKDDNEDLDRNLNLKIIQVMTKI
jgi:hypothetical protein